MTRKMTPRQAFINAVCAYRSEKDAQTRLANLRAVMETYDAQQARIDALTAALERVKTDRNGQAEKTEILRNAILKAVYQLDPFFDQAVRQLLKDALERAS